MQALIKIRLNYEVIEKIIVDKIDSIFYIFYILYTYINILLLYIIHTYSIICNVLNIAYL